MKKQLIALLAGLCSFVAQSDSLTLTWDTVSNADGYRLYQAVNSAPFAVVVSPTSPPVTVSVSNPNQYQYYVTAFNSAGESPQSNVLAYSPPPPASGNIVLSVPVLNSTIFNRGQTITANATLKNDTTTVFIAAKSVITARRPGATNTGGPFDDFSPEVINVSVQPGQTVNFTGTWIVPADAPAGQWRCHLAVQNASGLWTDGPDTAFTVAVPTVPAAPTNLRATVISASRIDIRWDAPPEAVTVRVERDNKYVATTSNSYYSNTGLRRDRTYFFRVQSQNAAGTLSAYSPVISARTLKR